MTTCSRCVVSYPDELVTKMFITTGGLGGYLSVCGICALAVTNEIHGTKRTRFDGEQAERMRQDALAWRRKQGLKR